MTPGQRRTMYLHCLHGAAHALTHEHAPQWGAMKGRAFQDARRALADAWGALATVTPAPDAPPAILRSEVEGVALNLACMASSALNPAWPTPADEALMGVVATLRQALATIAKENA